MAFAQKHLFYRVQKEWPKRVPLVDRRFHAV
jgi:hypothetical protein